jgi:hypothetical protein
MGEGTTITSSTSSLLEEPTGHMSKVRYYQPLSNSELNGETYSYLYPPYPFYHLSNPSLTSSQIPQ